MPLPWLVSSLCTRYEPVETFPCITLGFEPFLNTQESCIIAWSGEQEVILKLCCFPRLGLCAQVATVKWWMKHYGSPTAKRHYAFYNSQKIRRLDRGRLHNPPSQRQTIKTCVKYKDANGKVRYKGTKELRCTELLETNRGQRKSIAFSYSFCKGITSYGVSPKVIVYLSLY